MGVASPVSIQSLNLSGREKKSMFAVFFNCT